MHFAKVFRMGSSRTSSCACAPIASLPGIISSSVDSTRTNACPFYGVSSCGPLKRTIFLMNAINLPQQGYISLPTNSRENFLAMETDICDAPRYLHFSVQGTVTQKHPAYVLTLTRETRLLHFLNWEQEETKFPSGYGTHMLLRPVTAAVLMETTKLT